MIEIKFRAKRKGTEDWLYFDLRKEIDNDGQPSEFMMHYLDQDTVQQFTGLKDIHGKEIYEGDIVIPFSLENKMNKSVIVYEFNEFRIKGESLYWNWDLRQIEIIGNIYLNPELS